ncbi:hypothetical protein [Dongia sp. agr-C8]
MLALAGASVGWAEDGPARLHALLSAKMQEFRGFDALPETDRPRAVKCIIDALVVDIPEAEATRLADMIEQKIPLNQALFTRWLDFSSDGNPARQAQVKARAATQCPDVKALLDQEQG